MPNGGSDHCGNCRHNVPKVVGAATREQRRDSAYCTVRNIAVRASTSTYCANHYTSGKLPIGPMFGAFHEHERIPYHGTCYPRACTTSACKVCSAPSGQGKGVAVTDEELGTLQFCGSRHYVRWWKQAHPGEPLKWDCDADPPKASDAVFGEVQAKLELADAYLGMGDREGARDILNEVLRDGDLGQRDRARAMLSRC